MASIDVFDNQDEMELRVKFAKNLMKMALATALLSAGAANAAWYEFKLTGDYTASWKMDTEAQEDSAQTGFGMTFQDVVGDFPGYDTLDITFSNASISGGLQLYDFYTDNYVLTTNGPQLYTGKESRYEFLLGTFALTQFAGDGNYTLTITDLDALPPVDVPEPASIALLAGGLGLLAAARRRRSAK